MRKRPVSVKVIVVHRKVNDSAKEGIFHISASSYAQAIDKYRSPVLGEE